ncbi:complex I subunit 5 family protein [Salinispira pacifica]|uniref:Hydrogenase-4 component B/ Formate hydrogenlyase subunit 3 n=1 Tax=Salinispira pacifica TaxID=1307761 RepID=V5WII3_9SPIO|nr:proton-conducting transporter membrane subunit [Salinispira pacifica]AHC15374.1 Hydrogenase-4 component B/ Formate hydrogenlyase subunit 3 [Salinispira pacifica]
MSTINSDIVYTLVGLPLLGSALALFSKAFFKGAKNRILEYSAAFIGLALPWIMLIYTLPDIFNGGVYSGIIGGWSPQVGIQFRFDGLAWLVNLMGFTVAGSAWIYSLGKGPRGAGFTSVFLIQTAALAATSMTADIFNLFVCLEVMGIASYVLVASSEKPGAMLASFSYLMVSATAMVFFLIGIFGLYRLTGSLGYESIAASLAAVPDHGGIGAIVSVSLIVGAVAIRVAIMPVYGWLPDAHALAPHSISAVLSGVLIKTPLFALSRVILLIPAGARAAELMGYAGALTALVAVIIALSQSDVKRLLAYHSVSQIGYVVAAWGAALHAGPASPQGAALMTAAFLHALFHALFKGLLFLTVGNLSDAAGERNVYRLKGGASILRRAGERIPVTLIAFMSAALAITAIPPMNGYASKTALSYALKGSWEYTLLFAAGIGTVASFIKLGRSFFGKASGVPSGIPGDIPSVAPSGARAVTPASNHNGSGTSGIAEAVSHVVLTAAVISTGVFGPGMYRFVLTMFSSGAAADSGYSPTRVPDLNLYSWSALQNMLIILASGIAVYLLSQTTMGKLILKRIRERQRGFHGLLTSFTLGTLALAAWMYLA